MSINRETSDPYLDLAIGHGRGVTTLNKFGQNSVITTATDPEDVWDGGGLWVAPTAARVHSVTGGAADTGTGTGAQTVYLAGLDSDLALASQTVTMNGAGGVATNALWRIFRMYVATAGSGGVNSGIIAATAAAPDSTDTAQILAAKGQTLMAVYTVAAGHTFYMTRVSAALNKGFGSTMGVKLSLMSRGPIDATNPVTRVRHTWGLESAGSSFVTIPFSPYKAFAEKTDIWVRVDEVSATADISAWFDGFLVETARY